MTQPTLQVSSMQATRQLHHPNCFVCSPQRSFGLRVRYVSQSDGAAEATVNCPVNWQGYPGLVHGGIITCLLDGAMTNCLFSHDIAAVTADLHVRYRHPVELEKPARIAARMTRCSPPLFILEAVIRQDDRICVIATGKFMKQGWKWNGGR